MNQGLRGDRLVTNGLRRTSVTVHWKYKFGSSLSHNLSHNIPYGRVVNAFETAMDKNVKNKMDR